MSETAYDSRPETREHIRHVRDRIGQVIGELRNRQWGHDRSKLVEPELSGFDTYTPLLNATSYGSPEYEELLAKLAPTLEHHYAVNDHHPEHFERGVGDMNLLQVLEMLCDWGAATLRHDDGDLAKSISIGAKRWGYGPELEGLLFRTARDMGWL